MSYSGRSGNSYGNSYGAQYGNPVSHQQQNYAPSQPQSLRAKIWGFNKNNERYAGAGVGTTLVAKNVRLF